MILFTSGSKSIQQYCHGGIYVAYRFQANDYMSRLVHVTIFNHPICYIIINHNTVSSAISYTIMHAIQNTVLCYE